MCVCVCVCVCGGGGGVGQVNSVFHALFLARYVSVYSVLKPCAINVSWNKKENKIF